MKPIQRDSKALSAYLDKLSYPAKLYAIARIAEGCMVPRKTVHNWKQGLCRIPALHKCKIEEILGEKLFSSFESSCN